MYCGVPYRRQLVLGTVGTGDPDCRRDSAVAAPSADGCGGRLMSLYPTPQQERWMQIAARTKIARNNPWLASRLGGWKTATPVARCVFFVLGIVAAGLLAGVFELLHVPHFLWIAGVILVAIAEWLILGRRFFGAGIEEALELVGLLMIALQGTDVIGASAEFRISLTVATVLFAAGLRLLNPLLISLSIMAVSCALDFSVPHDSASAF